MLAEQGINYPYLFGVSGFSIKSPRSQETPILGKLRGLVTP